MLYGARQLLNSSFSILLSKTKKNSHHQFGNMKVWTEKRPMNPYCVNVKQKQCG